MPTMMQSTPSSMKEKKPGRERMPRHGESVGKEKADDVMVIHRPQTLRITKNKTKRKELSCLQYSTSEGAVGGDSKKT